MGLGTNFECAWLQSNQGLKKSKQVEKFLKYKIIIFSQDKMVEITRVGVQGITPHVLP